MLAICARADSPQADSTSTPKSAATPSTPADLFEAHIGGMDAFAAGLLAAHRIIEDGKLDAFVRQRYASFDAGDGKRFEEGRLSLEELAALASAPGAMDADKVGRTSGKQEHLENLIMQYVLGVE
jgi:D-xylose isomerase (EC 5.3.1.5)